MHNYTQDVNSINLPPSPKRTLSSQDEERSDETKRRQLLSNIHHFLPTSPDLPILPSLPLDHSAVSSTSSAARPLGLEVSDHLKSANAPFAPRPPGKLSFDFVPVGSNIVPFAPRSVSVKGSEIIPNRRSRSRSRIPGVLTPPTELWQMMTAEKKPESSLSDILAIPSSTLDRSDLTGPSTCRTTPNLVPSGKSESAHVNKGGDPGPSTFASRLESSGQSGSLIYSTQAPIDSERAFQLSTAIHESIFGTRRARSSSCLDRIFAELEPPTQVPSLPPPAETPSLYRPLCKSSPTSYVDGGPDSQARSREDTQDHLRLGFLLAQIKRNNPYTSTTPSMFNPIRAASPNRYKSYIADVHAEVRTEVPLNLRHRRSPLWLPQMRSRMCCEKNLSKVDANTYLAHGYRHCLQCQRDSLCKRLLVLKYLTFKEDALFGLSTDTEEMDVDVENTEGNNNAPPVAPRILDLDDFDDEDADAILLGDHDLGNSTPLKLF